MSIRNVKVRFNLEKENDRRAYEYLKKSESSYSKAVISAICGYIILGLVDPKYSHIHQSFQNKEGVRLSRRPLET